MNSSKMATDGWRLHHSMIRIKDPKASQHFYQDILGMTLLNAQRAYCLQKGSNLDTQALKTLF